MKKILLFACLLFSLVVNAQQSNFFDANEYLKNKNIGKNKIITQPNKPTRPLLNNSFISAAPLEAYLLPNGDRVISRPNGSMPVIKPDMTQFQAMPNPRKDFYVQVEKAGTIPNGARFVTMNKPVTKRK